jgi:hypothetical protein
VSSEVIAAIFGALMAGGLQSIVAYCDRKRQDQSVIVAIACEVETICHLIRQQGYLKETHSLLRQVELGSLVEANFVIDIRSNYFSVFESLSNSIGRVDAEKVADIVRFYGLCKTIVDGTRPDGVAAWQQGRISSVESLRALEAGFREALALGDRIVQFPKRPLRPILNSDDR